MFFISEIICKIKGMIFYMKIRKYLFFFALQKQAVWISQPYNSARMQKGTAVKHSSFLFPLNCIFNLIVMDFFERLTSRIRSVFPKRFDLTDSVQYAPCPFSLIYKKHAIYAFFLCFFSFLLRSGTRLWFVSNAKRGICLLSFFRYFFAIFSFR